MPNSRRVNARDAARSLPSSSFLALDFIVDGVASDMAAMVFGLCPCVWGPRSRRRMAAVPKAPQDKYLKIQIRVPPYIIHLQHHINHKP